MARITRLEGYIPAGFVLEEKWQEENRRLIVNGLRGIYVPQFWAETYGALFTGCDPADIVTLKAGPDGEDYWDAWDVVLEGVRLTTEEGGGRLRFRVVWHLEEDEGDVWLVPVSEERITK